jgi:hypothetical protein
LACEAPPLLSRASSGDTEIVSRETARQFSECQSQFLHTVLTHPLRPFILEVLHGATRRAVDLPSTSRPLNKLRTAVARIRDPFEIAALLQLGHQLPYGLFAHTELRSELGRAATGADVRDSRSDETMRCTPR